MKGRKESLPAYADLNEATEKTRKQKKGINKKIMISIGLEEYRFFFCF